MRSKKHAMEKKAQKNIAKERIHVLFDQAKESFSKDSNLSDRYVKIARDIAMRCKVRVPPELKKRFCKHCYSYLVPGINCRIRTKEGKVVYYCSKCRKFMRFPFLKEKKHK